jgi:hypothetical protein
VNELVNAIITETDWETGLESLIKGIFEKRKTNEKTTVSTVKHGGKAKSE